MPLDQFLPEYHFSEYHVVRVNAPPEIVFKAIKQADMSGSRLIKGLLERYSSLFRTYPENAFTLDSPGSRTRERGCNGRVTR